MTEYRTLAAGLAALVFGIVLSFLPRRWLQAALEEQWKRTLTQPERARLAHWGATGNEQHHPFQWADDLP